MRTFIKKSSKIGSKSTTFGSSRVTKSSPGNSGKQPHKRRLNLLRFWQKPNFLRRDSLLETKLRDLRFKDNSAN